MTGQTMEDQLFEDMQPVVAGAGLQLVDLRAQIVKDVLRIVVVIYREDGVGVDECAEVHRMLGPRMEAMYPDRDLRLEVSSPGIERTIRLPREYRIFQLRGVRVYSKSRQEWVAGIIADSDEHAVTIDRAGTQQRIEYVDIQKARLDDSQEV